jgi:hypothetical protein
VIVTIETADVHWLKRFLQDCVNHNQFPGSDQKPLSLPSSLNFYFGGTDRYDTIKRIVGVCEQLEKELTKPTTQKKAGG